MKEIPRFHCEEKKKMKRKICARFFRIALASVFFIAWLTGIVFAASFPVGFDGISLIRQPYYQAQFPIVITNPGSYKLASNIIVSNANTTAILVKANNVTIDMNGFSIIGPTVCSSNTPPVCTLFGTGDGVNSSTFNVQNTTIRNGTIQGMGNNGVNVISGSVEGVHAISNGSGGIVLNSGTVSNSTSTNNSGNGIYLRDGTVRGCTATGNGTNGIYLRTGTVSDSTSTNNFDDGIIVTEGGSVVNNKSNSNNAHGLYLGNSVGYVNNSLFNNSSGNVTGGVKLGNNVCDTVLCP
jgi:hypothetical protein